MSITMKLNNYIETHRKYFEGMFGNRNDVAPIRREIEDAFKAGYELAVAESEAQLEEAEERGRMEGLTDAYMIGAELVNEYHTNELQATHENLPEEAAAWGWRQQVVNRLMSRFREARSDLKRTASREDS